MVFCLFFVFFPSYLRHFLSTPIIDLRVALVFPRFFLSFFLGAITHLRPSARRLFFPLFLPFRTYYHPTFVLLFHLL
jgi:hypothetical protein